MFVSGLAFRHTGRGPQRPLCFAAAWTGLILFSALDSVVGHLIQHVCCLYSVVDFFKLRFFNLSKKIVIETQRGLQMVG